ncbi:MAG: hypothetical protein AAFY07_01620 [Pseudomonadota bacterium]
MMKTAENTNLASDPVEPSDIKRMIKITFGAALYLVGILGMIGMQNGAFAGFGSGMQAIINIVSSALVLVISLIWFNAISMPSDRDEPVAPSTRKTRRMFVFSTVAGAILMVAFFAFSLSSGFDITQIRVLSNAPIPAILGLGTAAFYAVISLYFGAQWLKNADEHERAAITAGLWGGFGFYSIAAPTWWLLQRAGIVPLQEPMLIYIFALTVFAAVWTYKRGA